MIVRLSRVAILAGGLVPGALLPSGAASAQERGAVEAALVTRYSVYDVGVGFDGAAGLGGRIGVFLTPNLALEFEGSYARPRVTDASETVVHELYQARLVGMHWLGRSVALVLGGGLAYDHYRGATRSAGARGGGPSGLMGIRLRVGDLLVLRLDGIGYLVPPNESAVPIARFQTLNLGVQAAASIVMSPPAGQ